MRLWDIKILLWKTQVFKQRQQYLKQAMKKYIKQNIDKFMKNLFKYFILFITGIFSICKFIFYKKLEWMNTNFLAVNTEKNFISIIVSKCKKYYIIG